MVDAITICRSRASYAFIVQFTCQAAAHVPLTPHAVKEWLATGARIVRLCVPNIFEILGRRCGLVGPASTFIFWGGGVKTSARCVWVTTRDRSRREEL